MKKCSGFFFPTQQWTTTGWERDNKYYSINSEGGGEASYFGDLLADGTILEMHSHQKPT